MVSFALDFRETDAWAGTRAQQERQNAQGGNTMSQVVIENPIINSPFDSRHAISNSTARTSPTRLLTAAGLVSIFVPIAKPKKKGKQLQFDTEWTALKKTRRSTTWQL
jgi:hypothetical protein